MNGHDNHTITQAYSDFISEKQFPCTGAKAVFAGNTISSFVANHLGCPADDQNILRFLYSFIDQYRQSPEILRSAVILFDKPLDLDETGFDKLLWQRLQALADLDAIHYPYDSHVAADPSDNNFSFSLKEESFYIIGLHPASSRKARQFSYPALVFNPHQQFERMKETNRYNKMKTVIRKRDRAFSGSVNPMLEEFGSNSEARQYSGKQYGDDWQCPFKRKR